MRTAGGPQHRGPRHGGTRAHPSRLLTASPGCRAGAVGKHRCHWGRGPSPGEGVHQACRGSPPTPGSAQSHLHTTVQQCPGPSYLATFPTCSWGGGPPSTPGRAPSQALLAEQQASLHKVPLLVSSTTRRQATECLRPQARPRVGGMPQGDHRRPIFHLRWGGCYAPLRSRWPPRLTEPPLQGGQTLRGSAPALH